MWLINNRTDKPFEEWIELNSNAASFGLFDAMNNKKGLAKWRKNSKGAVEVLLQLQSYEAIIVQSYATKKTGEAFPYKETIAQPQEIKGEWTINFLEGGPTIPAPIKTTSLKSWTELGGDDAKNFSGTAKRPPRKLGAGAVAAANICVVVYGAGRAGAGIGPPSADELPDLRELEARDLLRRARKGHGRGLGRKDLRPVLAVGLSLLRLAGQEIRGEGRRDLGQKLGGKGLHSSNLNRGDSPGQGESPGALPAFLLHNATR